MRKNNASVNEVASKKVANPELEKSFTKVFKKALVKAVKVILESDPVQAVKKLAQRVWARKELFQVRFGVKFESYEINFIEDTKEYVCTRFEKLGQESEFTRTIVKLFNEKGIKLNGKTRYVLNNMFSITFPNPFPDVMLYDYMYKATDGEYATKVFYIDATGNYCSLTKTSEGKQITIPVAEYKGNLIEFVAISDSASGFKKGSSIYVPKSELSEEVLNVTSHGIYKKLVGKQMTLAKLQAATTRVNMGTSPSTVVGHLKSYAIHFDVWDKEINPETGKSKNRADGQAYFRNSKFNFSSLQGRPLPMKSFLKGTSDQTMKTLISQYGEVIYICQSKMTEEQERNIDLGFEGKGPYVGKVVVVYQGNNTIPDVFGDLNAYKSVFDYKLKTMSFPVLDLPKPGKAKGSSQLFSTLIEGGNKEAEAYLYKNLLDSMLEMINKVVGEVPAPVSCTSVLDTNFYMNNYINNFAPRFNQIDQKLKYTTASALLNSISNRLNNFDFTIKKSCNARVFADFGVMFGVEILKEDEIYTKDAPVGVTGILAKYPKPRGKEFVKVKTISLKTIIKRINKADISEDCKLALIELYSTTESGEMVVALSEANMRILAGMDYDFDMAVFIWDEEFVALVRIDNDLVYITKDTPAQKAEFTFSIDAMRIPLFLTIAKGGSTVGEVTDAYAIITSMIAEYTFCAEKHKEYMVNKFTAILDYALNDSKENYDNFIEGRKKIALAAYDFSGPAPKVEPTPFKRFKPRKGEYTPLQRIGTIVYVSETEKARIYEQLKTCEITKDNLLIVLNDIEAIGRYDQEVTIDSSKTGIFTNLVIKINKYFGRFINKDYKYTLGKADGKITRDEIQLGYKGYIQDALSRVRDKAEAVVIPMVQEYVSTNTLTTMEQMAFMKATSFGNKMLEVNFDIRGIYSAIAKWSASVDEEAQASKRNPLYYEACRNMFNQTTGLTGENLAKAAFYLSTRRLTRAGVVPCKQSEYVLFNHKVTPKETLLLAAGLFNIELTTKDSLKVINDNIAKENMNLTFVDGIGVFNGMEVAVTSEKINGTFKISKIDEKFYAEKALEMDLSINREYIALPISYDGEAPQIGDKLVIDRVNKVGKSGYDNLAMLNGNVVKSTVSSRLLDKFVGEYEIADFLDHITEDKNGKEYHSYILLLGNKVDILTGLEETPEELESGAPEEIEDDAVEETVSEAPEEIEEAVYEDDFDYSSYIEDDDETPSF